MDDRPVYLLCGRGQNRLLGLAGSVLPQNFFNCDVHEWANLKKSFLELERESSGDQASDDDLTRLFVS